MSAPKEWNPDRAMGLELEANDLENQLEWAEVEGDAANMARLQARLADTLLELAETDPWPAGEAVRINAPRAADAA